MKGSGSDTMMAKRIEATPVSIIYKYRSAFVIALQ
jgi:hypothetical protein